MLGLHLYAGRHVYIVTISANLYGLRYGSGTITPMNHLYGHVACIVVTG